MKWGGGEGSWGGQVRGGLMVKQRGAHIPQLFAVCAQWSWQPSIGQKDPLCLHRSRPSVCLSDLAGFKQFCRDIICCAGMKNPADRTRSPLLELRGGGVLCCPELGLFFMTRKAPDFYSDRQCLLVAADTICLKQGRPVLLTNIGNKVNVAKCQSRRKIILNYDFKIKSSEFNTNDNNECLKFH